MLSVWVGRAGSSAIYVGSASCGMLLSAPLILSRTLGATGGKGTTRINICTRQRHAGRETSGIEKTDGHTTATS